jgi:3-oxoacyl-ACP reductase-like protein
MNLFGDIMNAIFRHPAAVQPAPAAAAATPAAAVVVSAPAAAPVDVEGVLSTLAAQKAGGGNWRSSIVDLLKLLDLDSSLGARKELAEELNVHVGADGSAEENLALHRAVMQKLADNGGKVPDSLKA